MHEYVMQGPGGPYTCLLDDRDAERFGAVPVETAAEVDPPEATDEDAEGSETDETGDTEAGADDKSGEEAAEVSEAPGDAEASDEQAEEKQKTPKNKQAAPEKK